jgi:hypothetical protein
MYSVRTNRTTYAICVIGISLATTSCEDKATPKPDTTAAPAATSTSAPATTVAGALAADPLKNDGQGAPHEKQPKVQVLHVDVASDFGGVVPCVGIKENLYKRGVKKGQIELQFTLQYMSRGARVTKTESIPFGRLTDAPPSDAHSLDPKKYVFKTATIDVHAQPVDRDTTPTASVEVVKAASGPGPRTASTDAELDEIEAEAE